jgi:hypothetical protein
MFMVGMEITFIQKVAGAVDDLNNPTYTTQDVVVDDCLVAPITEPTTAREQQAMEQSKDQVRVHMPKTSTADVGDSTFVYDGKTFKLDSSAVKFMDGNTPTRWNRYFRAESVNA